ncbi:MAG: type VI secretion system tip protein VgrG [Rubrivivax sp.]|nr:type VI secretion system tip protein VgrG [Rubrivivax sp.]MDP3223049.1 type VI secretion system tip protein VgrG [Rubrivivax sp.]
MPPSPLQDIEGPVRVTVKSHGTSVSERTGLISVTVRRAINRVPSATLVFADGDMPTQGFALSEMADFVPGAEIELQAGYGNEEHTIFKGIVVRQGLSIGGAYDARLTVECRDKAVKMTVGRKNAIFRDKSDADVMSQLIGDAGLTADVQGTTPVHAELIQHCCSDWDFMLIRAEANGQLLSVEDGKVVVAVPEAAGDAVLEVKYGESLTAFQGEIDAQDQYANVQAQAWDKKNQVLLQGAPASPARLPAQGNLGSATLAKVLGLKTFGLQSGAALSADALTAWAKAQQLKSGLSRLRGSMSFQGSALAAVGKLIDLKGVGERFSGNVLVTALTHTIEAGDWTTQAEFGSPASWLAERDDILAPPAAGLVPGIKGLHVGLVVKLDGDPDQEHRIQVSVPTAGVDHVWARLMQFHASSTFGAFFLPEIGDEVVLGWFDDDPAHPVVLGSLYSAKNVPPRPLEAANNIKTIVTRCQASLTFDDENKVITVKTPAGNVVVLSDKDKSITLTDQHGNKLELGSGGVTVDSPKDIKLSAKGSISIDAVGALSLSSKDDVKIVGLNVNATAQVGLVAKGSATAELSASGQTTVKGAMVMIN